MAAGSIWKRTDLNLRRAIGSEQHVQSAIRTRVGVLLLLLLMNTDVLAQARINLAEAELWLGPERPALNLNEPQVVQFTDYWYASRRKVATQGWYLFRLALPETSVRENWAVLVPNLSGRADVYWDGTFIGRSVPLSGAGAPLVAGPVLLSVPQGLDTPGQHELTIYYRGVQARLDYMRAPVVATLDSLQAEAAFKQVTLVYLPMVLGAISIVVALVFFAAFRSDPTAAGIGWLTSGLIAASVSVLGMYLSPPEALADLMARLRPSAFQLSILFFLIATECMRGTTRSLWLRATIGVYAAFVVAMLSVDSLWVYPVAVMWTPFSYAIGLYILYRISRLALDTPQRWLSLLPLILVPVLIVHDWVGISRGGDFWADQTLGVFNPALIAASLMFLLVMRARLHLKEMLALNSQLEARVAEKHQQLEENFQRMAEAERGRAALKERERMVRDMHDGLGSQLVSTLALVESGAFTPAELETALRDTLDDLRIMVHSLDNTQAELVDLLAMLRERLEPRLARQGIRIRWRVEDLPGTEHLAPEQATHILRIVQEAIANVLKHAGAGELTIEARIEQQNCYIRISDDGCGLRAGISDASPAAGANGTGKGLANMHHRTRALGAELNIDSTDEGTAVVLHVPLG